MSRACLSILARWSFSEPQRSSMVSAYAGMKVCNRKLMVSAMAMAWAGSSQV